MSQPKVFIIGAGGMVGATAAQALAIKEVVHEIILIDVAEDLVAGQAMDINHGAAFATSVHVRVGDYDEIERDDIVVITCGLPQKPGQSRRELLDTNAGIVRTVVGKVMAQGQPVFIVMVANPVDVLTHVALEASGLPKERVFGTGTSLDTARLQVTLANKLHVRPQAVQAYILGEHGDSSFPALSSAAIGGVPLAKFPGFQADMVKGLAQEIRGNAYKIIAAKHSTYYGIGNTVAVVVDALLCPTDTVLPLCLLTAGEYGLRDVVIGLPALISNKGARILDGYPLNAEERQLLHTSADIIRAAKQHL